jgi:hypothetical protein
VLGEDRAVVEDPVGVVDVPEGVDLAVGEADVREDVLHERVDLLDERVAREVVEDPGAHELAEAAVGVERDDVGDVLADEHRADRGLGFGDVVLHHADVGVLGLEVRDDLLEVLQCLPFELEEVEGDDVAVVPAAGEGGGADREGGEGEAERPASSASLLRFGHERLLALDPD